MNRGRERGAMLVIMAAVLLLFGILALGALTIMRIGVARQEVQRVADAACLAAIAIVKHDGLPLDDAKEARAAAIALRNHPGLDFKIAWAVTETTARVDVQCRASIDVSAPLAVWSGGGVVVAAAAQATIGQSIETGATRLYPKLVMVLDYSGSMLARLGDSARQPRSIDKLREAVNLLLDTGASFKYGLVIFASGVLDSAPVALDSAETIRRKVKASPYGCPSDNPRAPCYTNSEAALGEAHKILQGSGETGEAKYVLFVSDGWPTLPTGDRERDENLAFAQARGLWADDAVILTLHIINVGPDEREEQQRLMKFMQRISGYPEKPSDPSLYFNADSDSGIDRVFKNLGDAIGCPLSPLDPPPADPRTMHVFVKVGDAELPVGNAASSQPPATSPGDLTDRNGPFYDGSWFFYRAQNHSIYLSKPVCSLVIDQGSPVVIRSGSARLTQ